jgi:hypothetical protein
VIVGGVFSLRGVGRERVFPLALYLSIDVFRYSYLSPKLLLNALIVPRVIGFV